MLETKIDVNKIVLLIVDMENDLVKVKEEPFNAVTKMGESKGVIANTARVIAAARKAGMPVVFITHVHRKDNADVVPTVTDWMLQGLTSPVREAFIEGTPGVDVVEELKPESGDHVICKRRGNSFYNTDLELMLRSR